MQQPVVRQITVYNTLGKQVIKYSYTEGYGVKYEISDTNLFKIVRYSKLNPTDTTFNVQKVVFYGHIRNFYIVCS